MELQRVTAEKFKQAIEAKSSLENLALVKGIPTTIEKEEGDDKDRILTFTISTGDVDRDGDTLDPNGWELDNFIRGGSMLWGHNPKEVIAKPLATWLENGKLKSRAQFTPKDLNPFGYMIYEMFRDAYVRGTSVGFLPKKWVENAERGGWFPVDFILQELLEYSGTPVPSNPHALSDAKSKGIDVNPFIEWGEKFLDGESPGGLLVSRELAEQMYRDAKGDAPAVSVPTKPEKDTTAGEPPGGGDSGGGGGESADVKTPSAPPPPSVPESAASILRGMSDQVDKACAAIATKGTELAEDVKALLEIVGKSDKVLSDASRTLLREARDALSEVLDEKAAEPDGDTIELDVDVGEPSADDKDAGGDDDGFAFELDTDSLKEGIADIIGEQVDSSIRRASGRVD